MRANEEKPKISSKNEKLSLVNDCKKWIYKKAVKIFKKTRNKLDFGASIL